MEGKYFAAGRRTKVWFGVVFMIILLCSARSMRPNMPMLPTKDMDPTTFMWYTHPADKWQNALPIPCSGNPSASCSQRFLE